MQILHFATKFGGLFGDTWSWLPCPLFTLLINVFVAVFGAIFLEDEGTISLFATSDGVSYPTVLTPGPIPNDIFKKIKSDGIPIATAIASVNNVINIFGFFDFCKLILGDFFWMWFCTI